MRHTDEQRARHREYERKRRAKLGSAYNERQRKWYLANRARIKEQNRKSHIEAAKYHKAEMIKAYGGACICCGDTHSEFLVLDHKNGGGNEERKKRGSGYRFYVALRRQGYPTEDYQLLCHNCNAALAYNGYCPHKPEITRPKARHPGRPRTLFD